MTPEQISALERRRMSDWTPEEMHAYNVATGQYNAQAGPSRISCWALRRNFLRLSKPSTSWARRPTASPTSAISSKPNGTCCAANWQAEKEASGLPWISFHRRFRRARARSAQWGGFISKLKRRVAPEKESELQWRSPPLRPRPSYYRAPFKATKHITSQRECGPVQMSWNVLNHHVVKRGLSFCGQPNWPDYRHLCNRHRR
jgi:hypothetical protein